MLSRYFGYFTVREWIALIASHVIVYFGLTAMLLIAAYWHGWRP